jgi:hypothetical protein
MSTAAPPDFAVNDLSRGRGHDAHDALGRDALAAAAFADQAPRPAAFQIEIHPVERLHDAVVEEEIGFQVLHLQNLFHVGVPSLFRFARPGG